MSIITFPTMLTLARLILSPLVLPLLLVFFLPFDLFWINSLLGLLFVAFSLTDFFDGFFARRYHLESALGTMLDPIADKFLFYSVLVALLAAHKIYFYWVIVLIGREIFMLSLRQLALENHFSISVSYLGKVKTALQMVCLTVIILNPHQKAGLMGAWGWNGGELLLLSATTFFSVWSAYRYFQQFIERYRQSVASRHNT